MSQPQPISSQSYPTQSKSLGHGKFVAAIVVLSILLVGASGTAAYYYSQRGLSVNHAADLDTQIVSLNAQISSDKDQIATLDSRIDTLNQRISVLVQSQCAPDSGYSSCSVEIASLQSQVNQLQSEKATLQARVDNLTSQVNDLNDIVNLKKTQVLANSVTVNWASCGETSQPSCTTQSRYIYPNGFSSICSSTCYAGYLKVDWTSTQSVTAFFIFTVGSGVSTVVSSSTSAGTTSIPFPGTGSYFGGFQNDACFYDNFSNLHCPGGSLTYTETYIY
jgi:cell division protein FtsB